MKQLFDPNEVRSAYWLSAPALFLMLVLLVLPTLAVLALSLTDAELGVPEVNFRGLAAYADLLNDRTFLGAVRNTALYVVLVVPASVVLGLGLVWVWVLVLGL